MKRRTLIAAFVALAAATGTAYHLPLPRAGQAAAVPLPPPVAFQPAAWTRSAAIYEANVRQYTPEGTLAALQRRLPQLRALGIDILWIMPVQPIGKLNRKGGLGSPYSISNYTAVSPDYGTEADFKAVVDAAHRQGMKVILDWVANHTSFDNVWVAQHRDYYLLRPNGTISNARDDQGKETDWTDVAQLDYKNHDVWVAMTAAMRWWVVNMGVDGFRSDVAGGPPLDFWRSARASLDSVRPDLFWLAEGENPKLHEAFDATYGWELHHLLNEIAQGKKPTSALDSYFASQHRRFPPGAYRMYFTSNHDENSWNGSEFERMGANHLPAFILCATVEQSFPLVYTGQEVSMRKRLRFFEKDTVDWSGASLAAFYRATLALKHRDEALWNGAYGGVQTKLTTDGGDRVYAFTRSRGANTVLVAVNFGDAPARVAYTGLAHTGQYVDWFSTANATLASAGRLDIPAHGYRVLVEGAAESSNR